MRLPQLRIATRLMLAFALPTLLVVAAGGLYAVARARSAFADQFSRRLDLLATTIATQIDLDRVLSLLPGDEQQAWYLDLSHELQRQKRAARLLSLVVFDEQGRVFVDADRRYRIEQMLRRHAVDRAAIEAARRGEGAVTVTDEQGDPPKIFAYVPLALAPGEDAGGGEELLLAVSAPLRDRDTIRDYLFALLPGGLLLLLAVVLISRVVARSITDPMEALVAQARRIGEGDLQAPLDLRRSDEIGFLAKTLDEMRAALFFRDRERQAMLAGIAHEVRNPLGGMELFVGLLREGLAELPAAIEAGSVEADDIAELTHYNDRVQRELGYLGGVVNDFLAFAREMPAQRSPQNMADLLDELSSVLTREADEKKINIHVESPGQLEARVDRGAVHRALLNLAHNALHACEPGDAIRLWARPRDEGGVQIGVEDNGAGIPTDKLAEVQTPFFTTKEKGTGLGLAIVAKIARAHGGALHIDSEPGRGTRVTLDIDAGDAT